MISQDLLNNYQPFPHKLTSVILLWTLYKFLGALLACNLASLLRTMIQLYILLDTDIV